MASTAVAALSAGLPQTAKASTITVTGGGGDPQAVALFTSTWQGTTSDYNTDSNWIATSIIAGGGISTINQAPVGAGEAASFAALGTVTAINVSAPVAPDLWTFESIAPNYSITGSTVTLSGGVVSNGGNQSIANVIAGAGVVSVNGGTLTLTGHNTYTGGTQVNSGALVIGDTNNTGAIVGALVLDGAASTVRFVNADLSGMTTITNTLGAARFQNNTSAANVAITTNGNTTLVSFEDNATAGSATITLGNGGGGGTLQFLNSSTAGNAQIIVNNGSVSFGDKSTGGNANIIANAGSVSFGGSGPNGDNKVSVGSIAGAGLFTLGNELTVSGNNDTTVSSGIVGTGSLVRAGTGTLTLTGNNTYSGPTTVKGGALFVNGALSNSDVLVSGTGIFGGAGNVKSVTVGSGGSLVPGSAVATPGTLTVNGNLTLVSGANYVIYVTPSTNSKTTVTGNAAVGGTVFANFLPDTKYTPGKYTIVSASGGLTGSFATINALGLSAGSGVRNPHIDYDGHNAFLVLDQATLNMSGGTGNTVSVGNAINNFINSGGTLPSNFQVLTGLSGSQLNTALNSLTGETNTASQQAAAQLLTSYFNVLYNQMLGVGGGSPGGAGGLGATGFAPERTAIPSDVALAYDAVLNPSPVAPAPKLGWGVWGSGFGGYNKTDGDPATAGTGNVSARVYGFATGLDYRFDTGTTLGVSLAGAGTSWSVDGNGSGSSEAVQAAVYGVQRWGAAYIAGALAFTNHWMKTDRVTFNGDHLRATFDAQSYGGRLEGGYRFGTVFWGITPYAAVQSQVFRTPTYSETGGGGFGLTFASQSSTDTRSELGTRFDTVTTMADGGTWILGGRVAWAHDWVTNPSLAATFQTLPGASFTVNGATPAHDAALASLGSELRFASGVALLAKFDSELASNSQTYAGTGAIAYRW